MKNAYTDLVLEIAESLNTSKADEGEIDGVEIETSRCDENDVEVTKIRIVNDAGVAKMQKPIGCYISISSAALRYNNISAHEHIIGLLAQHIGDICADFSKGTTLVIGLGNSNVTPDALGPKVVDKTLVTRHIMQNLPDQMQGNMMSVCALAPSVMGLTGIETAEIVRGLVAHVRPTLVIVIDALAARKVSRINSVIQLTDTGIAPGGGMGNNRMPLNAETLGVPVVAIGVPTVVDAATLVNDTLDLLLDSMAQNTQSDLADGRMFFDSLRNLQEKEKYQVIQETLAPYDGNMFVTPKEIGEVVNWLANIIANGINLGLHPGLDRDDINRFMY